MSSAVIEARRLNIEYRLDNTWHNALYNVDLKILPLQIHGLVGESGSGKSTLGLAMMRYLAENSRIASGEIWFDDVDIAHVPHSYMRKIWGKEISLVPQNPLDALNPSLKIGDQMSEVTMLHLGFDKLKAKNAAIEALATVKIADPEFVVRRYPHQLSGGMQQRVMIAMALSTRPKLLILDEPTTAVDVTTQAVILDLVRDLIRDEQAAALYISHDLGAIAQLCDYVTVLYGGEVMESAHVESVFAKPLHPYTSGLLGTLPTYTKSRDSHLATIEGVAPALTERPITCVFAPRCPIAVEQCYLDKPSLERTVQNRLARCWRKEDLFNGSVVPFSGIPVIEDELPQAEGAPALTAKGMSKGFAESTLLSQIIGKHKNAVQALNDVSIKLDHGMTIGIVGESGSGKTTLARTLLALVTADHGDMTLMDSPLSLNLSDRNPAALSQLRMIIQNPNDALNPYHTVGEALIRTYRKLSKNHVSNSDAEDRISDVLTSVGLSPNYASRYPEQLSGGEKQRVAIARAFIANPAVIVADEPTSSLDVSIQATILNLLKDLRRQHGTSYIVISHDLNVISYLADWIVIMYLGEVMEQGTNKQINEMPIHPYTEALLSAIPVPDPTVFRTHIRLDGDVPSPRQKPSGCPFHTRCHRYLGEVCETTTPPVREGSSGHYLRCHIPLNDLHNIQSQIKSGRTPR